MEYPTEVIESGPVRPEDVRSALNVIKEVSRSKGSIFDMSVKEFDEGKDFPDGAAIKVFMTILGGVVMNVINPIALVRNRRRGKKINSGEDVDTVLNQILSKYGIKSWEDIGASVSQKDLPDITVGNICKIASECLAVLLLAGPDRWKHLEGHKLMKELDSC